MTSVSVSWAPAEATAECEKYIANGQSSKPKDTELSLVKYAPNFAKGLTSLKKEEKWGVFSCAEANAVAGLLKLRTGKVKLADIVISRTTREDHESLPPCKNCSQWLEKTGDPSGEYRVMFKIKAEFLPTAPKKGFKLDINDEEEFPSLS